MLNYQCFSVLQSGVSRQVPPSSDEKEVAS